MVLLHWVLFFETLSSSHSYRPEPLLIRNSEIARKHISPEIMKRTCSGSLKISESTHRRDDLDETTQVIEENYHVFLSFKGSDSRQGLADVLCSDMTTIGIRVFKDNDEIEVGGDISEILQAIENSKICIPIFSKTFAASAWCLREVERMVELKKNIMPIFYTASPDDVKLSTELFKEDLKKHEQKHGREQVQKWEMTLKEVAKIKGREVKTTGFSEFSEYFVKELEIKLNLKQKNVPDCLIKRHDQEARVMELLDIDSSDTVRLIGIHGMGGIGKTTLAKVIFNQISATFDYCSFLENLQEASKRHHGNFESLQKELLNDLKPKLKRFLNNKPSVILKQEFRQSRVLIVLDDVSKREHIKRIIGMLDWFGYGSRILVTTRDKRVFTEESRTFEMKGMNFSQALQLFSRHAFGEDSPPNDFRDLSYEVVSLTGHLPLALEVIGSLFYQKRKNMWKAIIDRLRNVPNADIQAKLRISFDALEFDQKEIFLDIACFFANENASNALIYMWEDCEFYPEVALDVIISMSLVKIEQGVFRMHNLIKDLGRGIVREKCRMDPSKQSRIWSSEDARNVLNTKQQKKAKTEGLYLEEYMGNEDLTNEHLSKFQNLRLLKLEGSRLKGDFESLLQKLKWFRWHKCPLNYCGTNLLLEDLVVLDLSDSLITENWTGWIILQMAKKLKSLNLTNCHELKATPNMSKNDALEELILKGCRNLAEIHKSIGKLTRLKRLDVEGCSSLRGFPDELSGLKNLQEILVEDNNGKAFHFPESIGNLCSLSTMKIQGVQITRIPKFLGRLSNLTRLLMPKCTGVEELPDTIGNLKLLVELNLFQTEVRALPNSFAQLGKLENLNLGDTKIEELPDSFGCLKSLEDLDLSNSKLRTLPYSIGDCESLVWLHLEDTELVALPDSVGQLVKLEVLSLESTNIEELPDSLVGLKSLKELIVWKSKLKIVP